jgi:hypothetical protein
LGFVVLLNLGECVEAWEVNEGIGTNFVSELAGEDCSIGMADSEGDEVSDVAEIRRLSIVKGMETRFLICPRMLRWGLVSEQEVDAGGGFGVGG